MAKLIKVKLLKSIEIPQGISLYDLQLQGTIPQT